MEMTILYSLTLTSALIFGGWAFCLFEYRRQFLAVLREIPLKAWFCVLGVVALGAAVQFLLVHPKNILYIDEFWYMEAAKNTMTQGFAADYLKSIGWPFLMGAAFYLFGISAYTAIYLCAVLGLLVPVWVFLIGKESGLGNRGAVCGSLFMALLPWRLVWSMTAETVVPALFFLCAGLYFSLLFYRRDERNFLWLASFSWACAAQIRPELGLFSVLFIGGIFLLVKPRPAVSVGFAAACVLPPLLAVPNFLRFAFFQSSTNWLEADSFGAVKGSSISLSNLWHNTLEWLPSFFNGSIHPVSFAVVGVFGLVYLWRNNRRLAACLCAYCAALYLFYFSTWFAVYGTTFGIFPKTKIFLLFYPALCVFAAGAVEWVLLSGSRTSRISAVLITAGLSALLCHYGGRAGYKSDLHELETRAIDKLHEKLPEQCLVLANAPVIIRSVNFQRTAYSKALVESEELRKRIFEGEKCVLYFDDATNRMGIKDFEGMNEKIDALFDKREMLSLSLGKQRFAFYELTPKPVEKAPKAGGKPRRRTI